MDSISNHEDNLAATLEARLMAWQKARDPQEQKMRDCYADEMRIARDDDTKGTGAAKAKKTKGLFVGVTRNKIRTVKAKLSEALFQNGKMPFDTEPAQEQLAEYADVMEDIINEQMYRGGFKRMLKAGIHLLPRYGTAFIFGPFVRAETIRQTEVDDSNGFPQIIERSSTFDLPYYEIADSLDVYPDPDVDDPKQGAGVFWVSMESKHTVESWADYPGFENIDEAVKCLQSATDDHGSDQAHQLRSNVQFWQDKGRVKVARFFGRVPKSAIESDDDLLALLADPEIVQEEYASEENVEAIVIMAGGVVIKKSIVDNDKRGVYRCVYEDAPKEMWGVGVAENNMPHQATVNAGFRLFNEGKGMALLGTKAVDRAHFLPTEDFKKYPGKVYQFKPGLTPEEKKASIIDFIDSDVSSGWREVIELSEQFSDDDTGVTKYTQGTDASHLNKTATGISMIMGASALPLKDVLQNIDEMWIEPIVEGFIDWNLRFLEPSAVNDMLGEEAAQKWQAIKRFGKSSFMTWRATGANTFMQKEVLLNKLQGFMQATNGDPLIDRREILTQVWDAMGMALESPVFKEDGSQPSPEVQQMQQQMQQMQQVIEQLQQQLQAEKNSQAADMAKIEADTQKAVIEAQNDMKVEELKGMIQIILKRMDQGLAPQIQVEQPLIVDELNGY